MSGETQQANNEPREYTLTELDTAVANGAINQTQRDQIWTDQVKRSAAKIAADTTRTVVQEETRNENLDRQLKSYVEHIPDLDREGSDVRGRVAREFEILVANGSPRTLATELAAVRAALGPIERVRQHSASRRRGPDAFGDTQSAQLTPQQRREDDAWNRIDPQRRAYYDKQISNGLYAGRAAVLSELNWRRGAEPNKRGTA